MTETQLWGLLRRWMSPHGKALRMETSTVPGFPDVLFINKKITCLFELKIIRNGKITLRASQVSFTQDTIPYIHPNRHCALCWDEGRYGVDVHTAESVFNKDVTGDSPNKLFRSLDKLKPAFVWQHRDHFTNWLKNEESK
jgi:hypothetical protein